MPVVTNAYYNDPAIAEGMASLAHVFAPPTAQELAAYAAANTQRQKAAMQQQQYDMATGKSPFSQDVFDRGNIAAGLYAPSSGYYGVDAKERGDTFRSLLAPLSAGQTRYVPQALADMYGLPKEQRGVLELQPGEKAVTQSGETFNGNAKPLSETEAKAAILRSLPADQQRSVLMSDVPVEQIVMDGKPQYVRRADAVGKTPYTQTPYDKANAESMVKMGDDIFKGAQGASADMRTYQTLLDAVNNPNVDQGALGQAKLQVSKLLNSLGSPVTLNKDTSAAEMLNALGNQIALRLRNPDGGAGMPGSLSDSDREYLRSMSVSLGNSRQANIKLAQYYMATAQRSLDKEKLREQYIQQHGRLDEGFRQQLLQYDQQSDPTLALRGGSTAGAAPQAPVTPAPPAGVAPAGAVPQPPAPPSPPSAPKRIRFDANGNIIK